MNAPVKLSPPIVAERMKLGDVPEIARKIKEYHATTPMKKFPFDLCKVEATLTAGLTNDKYAYFVVRGMSGVIGGIAGSVLEFPFSHDVFAQDHLFYVLSEQRTLFVAQALIVAYVRWAESKGALQIQLSTISGYQPERFADYVKRFGFKPLGQIYARD